MKDIATFPTYENSPRPTWKCASCHVGQVWAIVLDPPDMIRPQRFGDMVTDRGPIQVEIGDKKFDACSRECARDIYLVKSFGRMVEVLEAISERLAPKSSSHTHRWGPWQRIGEAPVAFRECMDCSPPATERESVEVLRKNGILFP